MTPELSSSGVTQDSANELAKFYAAAADRLREIILHPAGGSAAGQAFSRARALNQLHQVEEILRKLNYQAASWIGPAISQSVADGIRRADLQIADLGTGFTASRVTAEAGFERISQGPIKVLAGEMHRDLMQKSARSMADNAKFILHQASQRDISTYDLNKILANGVMEGQPAHTIRALREALVRVNNGTVTIQTAAGPYDYDAGKYARMVVRTLTREATVVSRHQRLAQMGIDLVSIVGRISKYFCTAYLGKVFSISGQSSEYPALADVQRGGPPFHPNCSKSTRPFVPELATAAELEQAGGVNGADRLIEMKPAAAQREFKNENFYKRVKDSYAATARELFGHAMETKT